MHTSIWKLRLSVPFWFGAIMALPLGIYCIPFAGTGGMALINGFWLAFFHHDAPPLIYFCFGLSYGLFFGPVVPSIVMGVLCHVMWPYLSKIQFINKKVERGPKSSLVIFWIASAVIYYFSNAWMVIPVLGYVMAGYTGWALEKVIQHWTPAGGS